MFWWKFEGTDQYRYLVKRWQCRRERHFEPRCQEQTSNEVECFYFLEQDLQLPKILCYFFIFVLFNWLCNDVKLYFWLNDMWLPDISKGLAEYDALLQHHTRIRLLVLLWPLWLSYYFDPAKTLSIHQRGLVNDPVNIIKTFF